MIEGKQCTKSNGEQRFTSQWRTEHNYEYRGSSKCQHCGRPVDHFLSICWAHCEQGKRKKPRFHWLMLDPGSAVSHTQNCPLSRTN